MAFNSSLFLLYFLPAFFCVYWLLPGRSKNWFLLGASILFYSWGAPEFLPVLALSVIIDFVIIRMMLRKEGRARALLFLFSVILNISLLLYFKYMNFFIQQINGRVGLFGFSPFSWTDIVMPIGISFITFQKLAYTFDVYRRGFPGFKKFPDYILYLFMFPQLLAGPILRPGQIAGQISDRSSTSTIDHKLAGFYRFIIGLAKKVLIADFLGITVNAVFAMDPSQVSTGLAWIGAITYSFQIYFDFSGYSDMAIGLALMAGFKLPENFNSPYLSGSITEFWKRWHITLSLWFRDYLFLPLAYYISRKLPKEKYAGLRADKIIYLLATSATFLLCGLWHGAAWTFIAWGIYQGLFLICDRLFLLRLMKKTGKIPAIIFTFFILTIGFVLFRSPSLHHAVSFVERMFSFSSGYNDIWLNSKYWTILVLAGIFSFWSGNKKVEQLINRIYYSPTSMILVVMTLLAVVLLIIAEASVNASGFSPFIYFRF